MENLIVIRLIHIVCAVIWAGGMIYQAAFVIPASKTLGQDGAKFIQHLSGTKKVPVTMVVAATLTIITGILLMQKLLGGIQNAFTSTRGVIIIIGSMLALAGFTTGLVVNIFASKRMSIIGKIAADSGDQFNATQLEELQKTTKQVIYRGKCYCLFAFHIFDSYEHCQILLIDKYCSRYNYS